MEMSISIVHVSMLGMLSALDGDSVFKRTKQVGNAW